MNYIALKLLPRRSRLLFLFMSVASFFFVLETGIQAGENLAQGFANPPASAKPRMYWFWIYNRLDKAGITRDLEQFKAKGISGGNLICNGG